MRKNLYSAIKKSVSSKMLTYLIQLFVLMLYSRMFTPAEFGVIALLHVFVVFFQLFTEVGIGPALINKDEIFENEKNGIFTFTIILGVFISILFYFFSFYLNSFYERTDLHLIAVFISGSIIFQSASIIPVVGYRREVKFFRLACIDIISEVVAALIVLVFWNYDYGLIALAVRPLALSVTKFFFVWYFSKETKIGRCYIGAQVHHIKSIAKFSTYQLIFNIINYFSRNLDNILIGKYFGVASLGIYDKSYQLMKYPLMLITFAMNPAIQPVLTKYKHNLLLIENEHNNLAMKLLIIAVPIALLLGTNSTDIVTIVLGESWLSVAPIMEVLALIIPVQMVMSTSAAFFQSINKPKLLMYTGMVSAINNVAAIMIGIHLGTIQDVAKLICFSFSFNFISTYFILYKWGFKSSFNPFFLKLGFVLLKYLPLCTLLYLFSINLNVVGDGLLLSVIRVAINFVLLLLIMLIFNRTELKQLKS